MKTMHARYEVGSRRLLHWSTVPFTTPPAPAEADAEVRVEREALPALPIRLCRLTRDLDALEVDREALDAHRWKRVRARRNALLAETDWTQVPDADPRLMTPGVRAAFAAYRQALRDITATFAKAGPDRVEWPAPPAYGRKP